jgi:dipeptidyl-peptidase-3
MKLNLFMMMIVGVFIANFSNGQGIHKPLRIVYAKDSPNGEKALAADQQVNPQQTKSDNFQYFSEQFADLRIIRYRIPGWDNLTLKQKEFVFYLTQAGYSGRDIIWDQNYRHNLEIRHALENIVLNYRGNQNSQDWKNFMTYTKRVWFSNGIHHHYSMDKILPDFTQQYFNTLLKETKTSISAEAMTVIFDPKVDAKKVSLDPDKDLLLASATNFYDPDITKDEAKAFYDKMIDKSDKKPISYGLNSKLVKNADGSLSEKVWKLDGMYSDAIKEIIMWLEKAVTVAENAEQAEALKILIEYYQTGDLKTWDKYNVYWVAATKGDIDYINSFIEVYNDPLGYRGSFESIVEINDFEASQRMSVVSENVQWFEDNSPIMDEHKKKNVKGVTYKVVSTAGESGDASPSTPIGVNLPNANWIRAQHGSKSVSLGNIISAYDKASSGGFIEEFALTEEEVILAKKYGLLPGKMHTALHEVVGHASGQLNPGIGTPKETLENYASTLEEGRADLVALYFMMDTKMVELGLMPSLEVGMVEYNSYIRNGMMVQLRRIVPGNVIEESHMRNRQMVASWAYEKGLEDNVIEKVNVDGKTYFVINDYLALREIFGELLRDIQRIKSEGDYEAGRALVEAYGVQVDEALHAEVLMRSDALNIAPYGGFINPRLVPEYDNNGIIKDVIVQYPADFTEQMLDYGNRFNLLKSGE